MLPILIIIISVAFLGGSVYYYKKNRSITYILGALSVVYVSPLISPLFFLLLGGGFGPGMNDFSYELSSEYSLYRNSAHTIMIDLTGGGNSETQIPPKVVELAWNDDFILAKQQHLQQRGVGDPYEEPVPNQYSYWIMKLNNPGAALLGPLDESTFNTKRISYNIDPNLKLRDLYDCKTITQLRSRSNFIVRYYYSIRSTLSNKRC